MDTVVDQGVKREVDLSTIQGKMATNDFDVFLCYHDIDNTFVKHIGEQLKGRGLLPWLDEWELRPGLPWQRLLEAQIENIKTVAVFVGANGIGPWQHMEIDAFLRQFVSRGCPVIPVILPDAPEEPRLPPFLGGMTWVDFRKQEPEPLARLIWGITGKKR
jgi:TIR domain